MTQKSLAGLICALHFYNQKNGGIKMKKLKEQKWFMVSLPQLLLYVTIAVVAHYHLIVSLFAVVGFVTYNYFEH